MVDHQRGLVSVAGTPGCLAEVTSTYTKLLWCWRTKQHERRSRGVAGNSEVSSILNLAHPRGWCFGGSRISDSTGLGGRRSVRICVWDGATLGSDSHCAGCVMWMGWAPGGGSGSEEGSGAGWGAGLPVPICQVWDFHAGWEGTGMLLLYLSKELLTSAKINIKYQILVKDPEVGIWAPARKCYGSLFCFTF